jgi:hypothetical protein
MARRGRPRTNHGLPGVRGEFPRKQVRQLQGRGSRHPWCSTSSREVRPDSGGRIPPRAISGEANCPTTEEPALSKSLCLPTGTSNASNFRRVYSAVEIRLSNNPLISRGDSRLHANCRSGRLEVPRLSLRPNGLRKTSNFYRNPSLGRRPFPSPCTAYFPAYSEIAC